MCGIAGIISHPIHILPDARERLAKMAQAMRHRGPDDQGVYLSGDGRVGLANRRLAIRDLSPAGHMPMGNADGGVWITYNGEIYNADELRTELEGLGYRFRSHSDTEVILHGYEAWGEEVVKRLRGMFAFAIYDARSQAPLLFLARDPLGIKPLYYAFQDGAFVFGSECKTVLASGLLGREISPTALVAYLQLGSVPAPLTIYRDIHALEAGHTLSVELRDGATELCCPVYYWHLPAEVDSFASYADAVAQVRELLRDSVRRHLVSDVPLGVFLSGGLDSGSIVALMREASPDAVIRTCSVVFDEKAYDESPLARQVAHAYQTEHVEVPIAAGDVAREMDRILCALDQPSNDGVNTYFVSKAARIRGLTVALSGLGADELFGGYPTFGRLGRTLQVMQLASAVPGGKTALRAGLQARGAYAPTARVAGWLNGGRPEANAAYLGLRGLFSAAAIRDLVRRDVLHDAQCHFDLLSHVSRFTPLCAPSASRSRFTFDETSRFELTCYMRHQLLRDTDAMSMAHSLEVRVPVVDQVVVEKVLQLPTAARQAGAPKQLLRDAMPSLPAAIRERKDKQGFTFPFDAWMAGPLRGQLEDLVLTAEEQNRALFQPGAGGRLLRAFDEGRTNWSRPWAMGALCCVEG